MRNFPDWIRAYVAHTDHLEAPPIFRFWTAISTIAGVLRGKCWIDQKSFKWKPNFFIVFVAPPGIANKSSTASVGMELLREVPGIHFGPESVTWQALTQKLSQSGEEFLINGEYIAMSNITVFSSEFGSFLNLRNHEMIDVLVDLWDGKDSAWTRRTKIDGEETIQRPWINILAATTPAWIQEHMPSYTVGGGFTSRTIFIYADKKEKLVAYPCLSAPEDYDAVKIKLLEDLISMGKLAGTFTLTDEAYKFGKTWYDDHWTNIPEHLQNEKLSGYVARKQTHMHKIAMVLSASQRDTMVIEAQDLARALNILEVVEINMKNTFAAIKVNDAVECFQLVLQTIAALGGKVDKVRLGQILAGKAAYQAVEEALNAAIKTGFIQQQIFGDRMIISSLQPLDKLYPSRETEAETSARLVRQLLA